MADETTTANKSDEDKAKQNDPKSGAPAAKVDHGELSESSKKDAEATEKVKQDPWGNTPAQARDQHDPLVDPASNDPITTGLIGDQSRGQTRLDPMEPQSDDAIAEEHGVSGGTNAPA